MARLIFGEIPNIQKRTVKEAVPFEMQFPDEFKTYTESRYAIPSEATFTQVAHPHVDYWDFIWTWYEMEI